MKTFIAATGLAALASTPGAVATTAMPWQAVPISSTPGCALPITANDVTKQCGTVDNPCIMKTGRETAATVCGKLYRLGVNYDNKYNATIVAKVAEHEAISTPDSVQFAVGQMGWQRLCPFQCAATPYKCVAFPENCTDSNVHPHTELGGHLIAGNAFVDTANLAGVATAAVQWMPHGHTDDTASGNVTLVANATSFNDTTAMPSKWNSEDTACDSRSFASHEVYNNTSCGATANDPCPAYADLPCNTIWKANFFAPAYVPPSGGTQLCTSNAKCGQRIVSKFFRILRNGGPSTATIFAPHSLWVNGVCPYLCRKAAETPAIEGQNVETCVNDEDACAAGLLVPNTIETLGTWENMLVKGSMNVVNPMYLTSLELISSSSVRAGAMSSALLIAVGLFANM